MNGSVLECVRLIRHGRLAEAEIKIRSEMKSAAGLFQYCMLISSIRQKQNQSKELSQYLRKSLVVCPSSTSALREILKYLPDEHVITRRFARRIEIAVDVEQVGSIKLRNFLGTQEIDIIYDETVKSLESGEISLQEIFDAFPVHSLRRRVLFEALDKHFPCNSEFGYLMAAATFLDHDLKRTEILLSNIIYCDDPFYARLANALMSTIRYLGSRSNSMVADVEAAELDFLNRDEAYLSRDALIRAYRDAGDRTRARLINASLSRPETAHAYNHFSHRDKLGGVKRSFFVAAMPKAASMFVTNTLQVLCNAKAVYGDDNDLNEGEILDDVINRAWEKPMIFQGHIPYSPKNAHLIRETGLKVVVLVRHPYATAYSMLRMVRDQLVSRGVTGNSLFMRLHHMHNNPQRRDELFFLDALEEHCRWLRGWAEGIGDLKDQVILARYEKFRVNRDGFFAELCAWLGSEIQISSVARMADEFTRASGGLHFKEGNNGAWRREISPFVQGDAENVLAEILGEHGFYGVGDA
jgi:hypothetical protein